MNTQRDDAAMLVARILLALMFVIAGFGKIGGFEGTAGYIASKGMPPPQLAAVAIVVELAGGIMLIVGWKARWAALTIVVFVPPSPDLPQLLGDDRRMPAMPQQIGS